MNIAIETSVLQSGHGLRGTGFYTQLLIDALQRYEIDNSYSFFTRGQKVPENADIVHFPFFDQFFLTLPLAKSKPTVVTVHDLIPIAYPDHFSRGIRGEIKWQIQKFSLKSAKEVITDSMASKADIARFTGISAEKINVVYLAPAEIYKPVTDKKSLKLVSEKYRLPEQFILYVGDVNWNKNIPGLLRALGILDWNYKLVLVGKAFLKKDLAETRALDELIANLRLNDKLIRPGFVAETDLPAVYTLASALVEPSFAEGFGLPVLEAMSCGTPVVTSDRSSLREIAGPAILIDPDKPDKIAEGIKKAFKIKKEKWSEESKAWMANFSLQKMAAETVEVYKKALGSLDTRRK